MQLVYFADMVGRVDRVFDVSPVGFTILSAVICSRVEQSVIAPNGLVHLNVDEQSEVLGGVRQF